MKKCSNPQCALGEYGGGLFADNDDYCSECGNKLVPKEEVNCRCGHHLGHNDKFCSGCGLPREENLHVWDTIGVDVVTERDNFADELDKIALEEQPSAEEIEKFFLSRRKPPTK